MLQPERKSGHWQVERPQFLEREERGLSLRYAVIDFCSLGVCKWPYFLTSYNTKEPSFFKSNDHFFGKTARFAPPDLHHFEKRQQQFDSGT